MSLIEATMVVSVVGVGAALGVPKYQNSVERSRLSNAVSRVEQDIEATRERARSLGIYQTIIFANDGYKIIERTATSERTIRVRMGDDPYRARIDWLSCSAGPELHFDGYGTPETSAILKVSHAGRAFVIRVGPGTGDVSKGGCLEGGAVAAADVGVIPAAIAAQVESVVPEPRRVGKVIFNNPLTWFSLPVVGDD